MPYISIREEDIQTIQGFDQVDNAVLIFGFNYKLQNANTDAIEVRDDLGFDYKLYTSLNEFVSDIKNTSSTTASFEAANLRRAAFRPYITAYDCLANGLPVIYVPIDNKIPDKAILEYKEVNYVICKFSDGHADVKLTEAEYAALITSEGTSEKLYKDGDEWHIITDSEGESEPLGNPTVLYEYLSEPDAVPARDADFWDGFSNADDAYNYYVGHISSEGDSEGYPAGIRTGVYNIPEILSDYVSVTELDGGLDFGDKINFPVTFITTCGFEDFRTPSTALAPEILARFNGRLDVLYLYDIPADLEPKQIITKTGSQSDAGAIAISRGEVSSIVYPWGHYNSYNGVTGVHMPGSYGYLMAYASSIKSNRPWLSVAGVTRGVIPNIIDVDYKISEAFIHNFQGDEQATVTLPFKINPIVDFGPNYGLLIFGNRTCLEGSGSNLPFRAFLNIRMLLIYIHKQAFASSIQHMFEPNDDIVWLSFKQKVNLLLDQMVSGRGIKWYRWAKIRPDKLGQIKARLTIRPIEAVESFDLVITMTDADVEITVE